MPASVPVTTRTPCSRSRAKCAIRVAVNVAKSSPSRSSAARSPAASGPAAGPGSGRRRRSGRLDPGAAATSSSSSSGSSAPSSVRPVKCSIPSTPAPRRAGCRPASGRAPAPAARRRGRPRHGPQLLAGELDAVRVRARGQHAAAGHHLDDVHAALDVLARPRGARRRPRTPRRPGSGSARPARSAAGPAATTRGSPSRLAGLEGPVVAVAQVAHRGHPAGAPARPAPARIRGVELVVGDRAGRSRLPTSPRWRRGGRGSRTARAAACRRTS